MTQTVRRTWRTKLGGLAASLFVRGWVDLLDLQGAMYDPTAVPGRSGFRGPIIALVWHEYLMTPLYLHGHTNSTILTSRHRDAEWLAESTRHMGYHTIRGSTAKGGSRALLELIRSQGGQNMGIACDGPLGPRRKMAPGPIYLSSKLQIPLIPFGVGYDRPWRMKTWDRFAIPRPGSRARIIFGPRILMPSDLSRTGVEHYRRQVERLLLRLTREAEAWAESRTSKQNQVALRLRDDSRDVRVAGQATLNASPPHVARRHVA
jgi:lysophospholipid acyltransferase (LPLAT)-like uncharacterized protein